MLTYWGKCSEVTVDSFVHEIHYVYILLVKI